MIYIEIYVKMLFIIQNMSKPLDHDTSLLVKIIKGSEICERRWTLDFVILMIFALQGRGKKHHSDS